MMHLLFCKELNKMEFIKEELQKIKESMKETDFKIYQPGDKVKIKPEWLNPGEDGNMVVVEDRGDRIWVKDINYNKDILPFYNGVTIKKKMLIGSLKENVKMEFIKEELNKIKESMKDSVVSPANYDLVVRELQSKGFTIVESPDLENKAYKDFYGKKVTIYFSPKQFVEAVVDIEAVSDLDMYSLKEYTKLINTTKFIVEFMNKTLK